MTNLSVTSAPRTAPWTDQYTAQLSYWYFRAVIGAIDCVLHKPQSEVWLSEWVRQTRRTYWAEQPICPCALSAARRWREWMAGQQGGCILVISYIPPNSNHPACRVDLVSKSKMNIWMLLSQKDDHFHLFHPLFCFLFLFVFSLRCWLSEHSKD